MDNIADKIEAALRDVDPFAPDTPNLNAWPQPFARREFAEWLAARISESPDRTQALRRAQQKRTDAAVLEARAARLKTAAEVIERTWGAVWCHLCGRYDCDH